MSQLVHMGGLNLAHGPTSLQTLFHRNICLISSCRSACPTKLPSPLFHRLLRVLVHLGLALPCLSQRCLGHLPPLVSHWHWSTFSFESICRVWAGAVEKWFPGASYLVGKKTHTHKNNRTQQVIIVNWKTCKICFRRGREQSSFWGAP